MKLSQIRNFICVLYGQAKCRLEAVLASKARKAYDANAKDIKRLLELHQQVGGEGPGRRYGLEVLNKSAVVLITAFWEAYCEDIASEGLEHLVKHAKSGDALPPDLKKIIAKKVIRADHELEVWRLSDGGWRPYLQGHLIELKEQRDRRLNTPKTSQINELFKSALGIEEISKNWRLTPKMTAKRAEEKLDRYISLRGAIAHRGKHETGVTKKSVSDYFEFINSLVGKTGGKVNRHVRKVTGKSLW